MNPSLPEPGPPLPSPSALLGSGLPDLLADCQRHVGQIAGIERAVGGNVSHVFRVRGAHGSVILKIRGDSFPRIPALRTDPALIADERQALAVYAGAEPSVFPRVLAFHAQYHAMILTDAFPDRRNYHQHLDERPATAEEMTRLGSTLRRVHRATQDVRTEIRSQGDLWFREHTFDFCLRTTGHDVLSRACDELAALPGQQLILGDLAPKNLSLAAGGSFSFISDDPSYQPAEPCLDFSCRAGEVMSLPTATKPAFLVYQGRPMIGTLDAAGTLDVRGRSYRWIGSKVPRPDARQPGVLTVFGAANCRVRYTDHPRTGFVRHVDQTSNITPPDPSAIDCVVSWEPGDGHKVTSVHPGGGAGLFAGNFVLRTDRPWAEHLQEGATVRITRIAGLDVRHLDCGISLGPSVADAATGLTSAYDQCLGTSPFRDTRNARTLIGLHGPELWFQVLDGAPLSDTFRGVSPTETAELCAAEGRDPRSVYHLDGGRSSKIAFIAEGRAHVVGSMHYLRWPRSRGEPFRWQGLEGRVLRSGFVVTGRCPEGVR